jgi:hypothetical protein
MDFGINLRFDLKALSDSQLAELLERSWQRHDAAKAGTASYRLLYSGRGPVRHPSAYPFISVLRYGSGLGWSMGPAISCCIAGLISSQLRAVMQMHLAMCDIADVTDELQRRLLRRGGAVPV